MKKIENQMFDAIFVHKILNGKSVCSEFLQRARLKKPFVFSNSSHNPPFSVIPLFPLKRIIRTVQYTSMCITVFCPE